jgi:L-alanine-DL-glutamate epimerase-like enolase superfamily enzyme
MIAAAQALNFKVMLGCMAASPVLAAAAADVGLLAEGLDLDRPLLPWNDLFRGICCANGRIAMPNGPAPSVAPAASNVC